MFDKTVAFVLLPFLPIFILFYHFFAQILSLVDYPINKFYLIISMFFKLDRFNKETFLHRID